MPTPPSGFNPIAATDAQLARYGFPPRPGRESNPQLRQKWHEMFGRSVAFVEPQFSQSPHFRPRRSGRSVIDGDDSPNWSGVVASPPAGDSFNVAITAVFSVPRLTWLGDGTQFVGIWIGIGGQSDNALLQAGVNGSINSSGSGAFYAFFEWLSPEDIAPATPVSNFPVNAGDSVEVQIWVTSATTATLVMQNLTSKTPAILSSMAAPPKVSVSGVSAEWIVERPGNAVGKYLTLADYSPVVFTDAIAWAKPQSSADTLSLKTFANRRGYSLADGVLSIAMKLGFIPPVSLRAILRETAAVFAESGSVLTMTQDGMALSTAEILGSSTIQCQYAGPLPSK